MPSAGQTPYNVIAIMNESKLVTDAQGKAIVGALNSLLPKFCNDWNMRPVSAVYYPRNTVSPIPIKCYIYDNTKAEATLAYEDEINDVPYTKVFVQKILENGGAVLAASDGPTVSQRISHEVFEILVDLRANSWWSDYSGVTFYAAEVCDPVESNVVPVTVGGALVQMSDWVLPAWSDPQATKGPFNYLNTLTNPMSVDKGGYIITQTNGTVNTVTGCKITSFTIANMCNRSIKRVKK
jgi:hypothetical protein